MIGIHILSNSIQKFHGDLDNIHVTTAKEENLFTLNNSSKNLLMFSCNSNFRFI